MKNKFQGLIHKKTKPKKTALTRAFENDVASDQARAVYVCVNARLLNKYNGK